MHVLYVLNLKSIELNFDLLISGTENCNTEQNKHPKILTNSAKMILILCQNVSERNIH